MFYILIIIPNMKYFLFVLAITCPFFIEASQAVEADAVSDKFIALAVQGKLQQAQVLLSGFDGTKQTSTGNLKDQFEDRFVTRSEKPPDGTGDAFIDDITGIFREYWARTLMGELTPQEGDAWLKSNLTDSMLQHSPAPDAGALTDLVASLGTAIEEHGYHYLHSPGPPVRDFLIWKNQTKSSYVVKLVDQAINVKVNFVSGFILPGWKHFASLGLASTTGWIEDGSLNCVDWAYDLNSENFEVSFLKHESQHLADFDRFPGLDTVELEYRAKLVELAFANQSMRRLLDDFTIKGAPNPESPHAFASYRVSRDLYLELYGKPLPMIMNPWMMANAGQVNGAARALLARNTEKLTEIKATGSSQE